MGKFITGIILFAVSLAAFCFGTYFLYSATHIDDAAGAVVGVVLIPIGLMFYGAGAISGIISEILLWSSFAKAVFKTACLVIAIVLIAVVLSSAGYLVYLVLFAS